MKHCNLNELAISYRAGNDFSFDDLIRELNPLVRSQARKAARRAEEKSVFIPATDFESAYFEAVWYAAKTYNGTSEFRQRLWVCMKRNEAAVWRKHQTNMNGKTTYTKAKTEYLDKPLSKDSNETLGDRLSVESFEEDTVNDIVLFAAVENYMDQNLKYYLIIKLSILFSS